MKKCPYCAEVIQDEAIFCRFCGRDLRQPMSPSVGVTATPRPTHLKKPWLAVVLNLFPLMMGLGYAYLGHWVRFVVIFGTQLFSLAPMTWLGLRDLNPYFLAAMWIFSLFDAYSLAKSVNARILASQAPSPPSAA